MILSHALRCVFIKGKKVGGTSVEIALSARCGADDILTPLHPVYERARHDLGYRTAQNFGADPITVATRVHRISTAPREDLESIRPISGKYVNHMGLSAVVGEFGPIPPGYIVVCSERCPYRKVISLANFRLERHAISAGLSYTTDASAVRSRIKAILENGARPNAYNLDRYLWPDGTFAPHVILRCAHLEADFAALMRRLKVADPPPLPHARRLIDADRLELRDYLGPAEIERINILFADEFERFGYPRLAP